MSAAGIANTVQPTALKMAAEALGAWLHSYDFPPAGDPLLDSAGVLRLLRNRVPGLASRLVTNCTVSPLKSRFKSRRAIAIDITLAGPGHGQPSTLHWIAKTHADGTGAVTEFRALSELTQAGFGSAGQFRVPSPICLMPDWRLFVQERASGSALRTLLGTSGGSAVPALRRTAHWLRHLHSLKPPRPLECEYHTENRALDVFTDNLRCRVPRLGGYLDRQGARLREWMAGWRGIPATLVHGDFHPENVYLSEDAVTVIDFDRFAIADPARDLGSFVAQVRAMSYFSGLPGVSAEGNARSFLEEYVRGIPLHQAGPLLERVAVYAAFFALEVGYYTLCVLGVNDPFFARDWLLYGTGRHDRVPRTNPQKVDTGGQDNWDE